MGFLSDLIDSIIVPLSFPFMQRALVGCVLVGVICAVLGVFVVLQQLSFIGQGLAQGALPGLAIGFATGVNLYLSGLGWAIALALGIAFLRDRGRVAADTAIAVAFSISTAIGIALISAVRFGPVDVNSYLFGNVLAIGPADLRILAVAGLVLGLTLVGLYREFVFAAFDPESAAAAGVAVRPLGYLFLALVAVAVVVSLQSVGLILVTALLTIPAASARQWVDRLPPMLALAAAFGAASAVVGLYASYHLRVPSGATIVLTAAIIFLVSFAARGLRDARGRHRDANHGEAAVAVNG